MVTSENLIVELRNRNTEALDYLLEKYSNLIYSVAFRVLKNNELSEECLNTTLFKVWEKIDSYNDSEENFERWIFSVAKFSAIDILRKEVRHSNSCEIQGRDFDSSENIEKTFEIREELVEVIKVIETFGEPDNDIFIKRFMMNFKVKDIAQSLNMSEKAVSLRILRGRKKIQKLLGGYK